MVRKSSQDAYTPQNLLNLVIDEKGIVQPSNDDKVTENTLKDDNNDIAQNDSIKDEPFSNVNNSTK